MDRHPVESVMGAVVLAVAAIFLIFAYTTADIRPVSGYPLVMRFDRIDGLELGAEVRIGGVKVGSVVERSLDPEMYLAVVTARIDPSVRLPDDTVAEISSEGLDGEKYVNLVPGTSETTLPPGGEIQYTRGSVDLVSLIGRLMFGRAGQRQ